MSQKTTAKPAAKVFEHDAEKIISAGKESLENSAKFGAEAVEMTKAAFEAWTESATVLGKGAEQIGGAWFALMQRNMDRQVDAAKAIAGCKTLKDVLDYQNDFIRLSYEDAVGEAGKLTEIATDLAQKAAAPLTAQANAAFEKVSKPLAA